MADSQRDSAKPTQEKENKHGDEQIPRPNPTLPQKITRKHALLFVLAAFLLRLYTYGLDLGPGFNLQTHSYIVHSPAAAIYTVDQTPGKERVEAMWVKRGRIIMTGTFEEVSKGSDPWSQNTFLPRSVRERLGNVWRPKVVSVREGEAVVPGLAGE
jgi:hypothetical protein